MIFYQAHESPGLLLMFSLTRLAVLQINPFIKEHYVAGLEGKRYLFFNSHENKYIII